MKQIKPIELYYSLHNVDWTSEDESNIEYLLDKYPFEEEDKEYLSWYLTHGDSKQDYIDNLISYCEYLKTKEDR
jgi:hypothetical protein